MNFLLSPNLLSIAKNNMGSRDRSNFLFVAVPYKNRPDLSKTSLSAVRKHVMNNYLQQQQQQQQQQHGSRNRTMQFRNQSSIVHRQQSPPRSESSLEGLETQILSPTSLPAMELSSIQPSPTTFSNDINPSVFYGFYEERCYLPFSPTSLSGSFEVHRLDPFDTLPVTGTIAEDELLRWHTYPSKTGRWETSVSWLQIYNNTYIKSLWKVSMQHMGLFHIMLCIGQARRAMERGHHPDTLIYHHTKAMRYIREQQHGKPLSCHGLTHSYPADTGLVRSSAMHRRFYVDAFLHHRSYIHCRQGL